ncbi:MAG: hypothetical protein JWM59_34 [Verrucomicrobiales bacterium]|nr:hypothetical protein [Verrucomicrobiales bacterium]
MLEKFQPMGIHAGTGKPLRPPVSAEVLASWILQTLGGVRRAEPVAVVPDNIEFKGGLPDGIVPDDLSSTGWAVLWAPNTPAAVKDALAPLLQERKAVAGPLYREIDLQVSNSGELEDVSALLERHQVSPGTINPAKLPYYLLIVGEPVIVPYEFQTALAVDYAVGRLTLTQPEEWQRYAEAVVAAEKKLIFTQKLAFFGPTNDGDPSTSLSAKQLIEPLAMKIVPGSWKIQSVTGPQATKDRLARFLHGSERVPVVFSATHGVGFDMGDAGQLKGQGAILCENGEQFTAADLQQAGDLRGLVWFSFACFGAGTPRMDNFPGNPNLLKVEQIAPHTFQSALATQLLAHPAGPALGFFGHVDLAWTTSFKFGSADSQTEDFRQTLERIIRGERLGHALHNLGQRYASLSTLLAVEMITALQKGTHLRRGTASRLARYWTAAMDARNYVLCGDPAARLRIR